MRLFAIYHPVLREIPRKTGLFLCFHGFFRLFSFPGLFWTLHVFQQPSSAGHGLNLQDGGSTIIWYTMPWSLELYQQTNARLWRQGQQSETVVIHHLVASGTIDEDIMKVLENKDKTQAAMMKAVKARVRE